MHVNLFNIFSIGLDKTDNYYRQNNNMLNAVLTATKGFQN